MDTAGGKKRGNAAADDQGHAGVKERGDPGADLLQAAASATIASTCAGYGGGSSSLEEDPGLEQGLAALLETAGGASVDRPRQATVSQKSSTY